MKSARPTAIIFAGGGSLGAIQVGMLKEIVSTHERFDFAIGASVGAINAAYFSRNPSAEGIKSLETIWRNLKRADIMPFSISTLWKIATRADSIFDGQALRQLLDQHLAGFMFTDSQIRLRIVATDIRDGRSVELSNGHVVDALMASTAIPGVFPPVSLKGQILIDGGVSNNTPISTALKLGCQRLIILPTGYACKLNQRPTGVIHQATNALNHLIAR